VTTFRWLWQRVLWLIAWLWRPSRSDADKALGPTPPPKPVAPRYKLIQVSDDPDVLAPHTVYAVGEGSHLWHVVMECPCGCGDTVALNVLPDDSPRWSLRDEPEGPTLIPSVWRTTGCRSHYILRRGRVLWCGSNGQRAAELFAQ
jgi:hypothetical protein